MYGVILQLLYEKNITRHQIFKKNIQKYRQSIHESLEILSVSGLLEKYYDTYKNDLFPNVKYKKFYWSLFQ